MTPCRYSTSSLIRLGFPGLLTLGAVVVLCWTATSGAQGFGPDPFQPYNSDYAPYVYPVAPSNNYGYNGQAVRGLRGANQFQSYMDSLQNGSSASGTRGGAGTPYYRANRRYDRDFGRIYQPNKEADKDFDAYKEKSTDLYFKYLGEHDPRRRAELYREFNRARGESDRALSSGRSNARQSARSTTSERRGSGGTVGSRTRDRDALSAPPPLSSDRARSRSGERPGGRGGSTSSGSAPPPLSGSELNRDTGNSPSPSDVLERSLRLERERSRLNARRRSQLANPDGPPPPTP